MPNTFALARTDIVDSAGNMNRAWVLFFSALPTLADVFSTPSSVTFAGAVVTY